tara:strand:- start:1090 stop:2067 length:978 start_codon:yes stop_codon:yes gene_type:complete
MKCILITGISGSGGSYLAEHILKKKNKIKIVGTYRNGKSLKRFNLNKIKKKIILYKCDLQNYKKVKILIQKYKPNLIYHLASNADVKLSFMEPKNIIENNNSITLNLLEAAKNTKFKGKIVICSTSEVYGDVESKRQPITEKTAINPINPYAVSKTFQDLLSQNYNTIYGLKIIITRMFTYLNARRDNLFASAFANQLTEIKHGKRKSLQHGNLNTLRSVLDIRDAMEAYWLAGTKGKVGEIYNICGTKKITVKNFLYSMIKLLNVRPKLILDKSLVRPNDISIQISNCKKFKKDTGWREKYNFEIAMNFFLDEIEKKLKHKKVI